MLEEKGFKLEIKYFDIIDSTHKLLCDNIREHKVTTSTAFLAYEQEKGVGSRGNIWQGEKGDFFFSFALEASFAPTDLPHESASIYFSWLMLEVLRNNGSKLWLKWPNDFYINDKKIGGVITTKIKDFFVVSMGINLAKTHNQYQTLDININKIHLVNYFINSVKEFRSWKHIFSKYRLEFSLSQNYSVHIKGEKMDLRSAQLCSDGSILLENKKVYSLR